MTYRFKDILFVSSFHNGNLYKQYLLFIVDKNSTILPGYSLFVGKFDFCENTQKLVFMREKVFNKLPKTCKPGKTFRFEKPPFLIFNDSYGVEISQETLQQWLIKESPFVVKRENVLGHNR